jgi:hypothetical protein
MLRLFKNKAAQLHYGFIVDIREAARGGFYRVYGNIRRFVS